MLVVPCQAAVAQSGPVFGEKSANVVRLDSAPVVDGRLDESLWSQATVISDLRQARPNEFESASESTQFYMFYTDEALYVGVRVMDSKPEEITAQVLRQGGGLLFEDRVAVILDPFYDKRNGYMFEVNPNGVRLDGLWQNTTDFATEWDGIWDAAAHYTDNGWTAEMEIPFRTLSFDPDHDEWGVNVWRFLARKQEMSAWSSRNRAINPSTGGVVRGFEGLDQGAGLDIVPSISFQERRDYGASQDRFDLEPSLDVYYKLTPGLNASITLNTDFSATEVDARQINLTRFDLFFPERRAFFLKESDIFEFGKLGASNPVVFQPPADTQNGKPFFSRRIGLSDTGQPVDLEYGAKLSGRAGEWNLGALAIRQAAFEDIDATDLVVARVSRNVLSESTLGAIATYGDPRSNDRNALVGFDFQYRNTRLAGGQALESEIWYQKTDTDGLDGRDEAFGFNVAVPNTSKWRGGIGFKELQENFSPRLGFANRTGVRNYFASIAYTHRPRNSFLRTALAGLNYRRFDRIDGSLDTEVIFLSLAQLENQRGDKLSLAHFQTTQGLIEPFEISQGVILPVDEYEYRGSILNLTSGSQRPLQGQIQARFGEFFTGDQLSFDAKVTWRPSKHYGATVRLIRDDIRLAEGAFVTRLLSLENEIVFSARWAWVTLAQYDNVSDSLGVHSRLHWIPRAGREMFIVLNHDFVDQADELRSTNSQLVVKFNYTFRF
jgi:hypothetical protein